MANSSIGFRKIFKKRKLVFGESPRPWANMDSNLLFHIFSRLTAKELFYTVAFVCVSWSSIFWEVFFWKDYYTLDLSRLKSLVRSTFSDIFPWQNKIEYRAKLLDVMEFMLIGPHVLGNTQRCVTTIIVPRNLYISGLEDVTFLSKRTPCLKRLILKDAFGLEDGCFSEALKSWRSLEEISIGPAYKRHVVHIIQELGLNCKNLHTLNIDIIRFNGNNNHLKLDLGNAKLIITKLPQLREFRMVNGDVSKDGVSTILEECKQLLVLCFESCRVFPEEINKVSVKFRRRMIECTKWCVIKSKSKKKSKNTLLLTSDEILGEIFT